MAKKKTKTRKRRATKKASARKKSTRKKTTRRAVGRPSGLKSATTAALQKELDRRLLQLETKRDQLLAELAELDEMLGESSSAASKPRKTSKKRGRPSTRKVGRPRKTAGRKRPRNATNLVEALGGVLKGKTMSVTDVAKAVQKAGYKTSSPNFRTIVNQTLLKNKKVFKKVSRGQYTAS